MSQMSTDREWRVLCEGRYDPDGPDDLTNAVVDCIAQGFGWDEWNEGFPRLYEYIDLESVETMMFHQGSDTDLETPRIDCQFEFESNRITISNTGWIRILSNRK